MPAYSDSTMMYRGNFAQVDTDESDDAAETPAALLALHAKPPMVTVTQGDVNDDGLIADDEVNVGGDTLAYDLGGGVINTESDSAMVFNATVTLGDGSTSSGNVLVLQTVTGDVFVMDGVGLVLDNISYQSLQLNSVANANYSGYEYNAARSISNSQVVCFGEGTRIETPTGARRVQDLKLGDLVHTIDRGAQPVRWIWHTELVEAGDHAPVCITAGALGPGLPERDLWVSPQHRILVRSKLVDRMFNVPEILVAARHLVGFPDIIRGDPTRPVSYWHLLPNRHEVVLAEGTGAESLCLRPETLKLLDPDTCRGIAKACRVRRFDTLVARHWPPARLVPKGSRVKSWASRAIKNRRQPLEITPHMNDAGASSPDLVGIENSAVGHHP